MTTGVNALVTGASGFLGQHLCRELADRGWSFDAVNRHGATPRARNTYGSLAAAREHLDSVEVVFHLAGLAHGRGSNPLEIARVNVEETSMLYAVAGGHDVRAFVWLSSIKVLGDTSDRAWCPSAEPDPQDAYAESKAQAEAELKLLAQRNPTRLHIVRPPIVYGPGVGANFLSLLKLAARPWPWPLGRATAPRSWVGVANLTDFLIRVADADEVEGSVWHVRDMEEESAAGMIGLIREAMGQRNSLMSVNDKLMLALARPLGLRKTMERLFLPQRMDMRQTIERLGWHPPQTQRAAVGETVQWFRTL